MEEVEQWHTIVRFAACPKRSNISLALCKLVVCKRDSCINSIECSGLLTAAEGTDVCSGAQIRKQLHSTSVKQIHKHIFSPIDGHLRT